MRPAKVIPGRFLAENLSRNFTLAPSEGLRRRDAFCRSANNDIYDKGVIWHGLCFIFSNNKKHVARSSLAGGSETPLIVPERIFLTTKARTIWHENGMVRFGRLWVQ